MHAPAARPFAGDNSASSSLMNRIKAWLRNPNASPPTSPVAPSRAPRASARRHAPARRIGTHASYWSYAKWSCASYCASVIVKYESRAGNTPLATFSKVLRSHCRLQKRANVSLASAGRTVVTSRGASRGWSRTTPRRSSAATEFACGARVAATTDAATETSAGGTTNKGAPRFVSRDSCLAKRVFPKVSFSTSSVSPFLFSISRTSSSRSSSLANVTSVSVPSGKNQNACVSSRRRRCGLDNAHAFRFSRYASSFKRTSSASTHAANASLAFATEDANASGDVRRDVLRTGWFFFILSVTRTVAPRRPRLARAASKTCFGVTLSRNSATVPFASTTETATTWLDSEPCRKDEPCVAVAAAPPTVWSINQGNAAKVYPGCVL